ncbi:MAG TPA: 23S rRNA (uracil(1939)-C(5))-methyltransferase RlmD [Firmicutes bacterium]|nr:23S rRNA (uracil(1939)-C(5))-methyltransferase RlmD [Bacillota bacterium]
MPKSSPPVRPGQILELDVVDLNHAGEGVGKIGSFAIFIPGGLPGERIRAKIVTLQRNYARALLEALLISSENRTEAPCRHFASCGGCQFQHLHYREQLHYKREIVAGTLRRLGGLAIDVLPVLGMKDPWHYRNKAQFPLGMEGKKLRAGFYKKKTHQIVDLQNCPIQHPLINRTFGIARALVEKMGIPIYNEKTHWGFLRHLVVRVSGSTGEVLVIPVTNGRDFPQGPAFAKALSARIPSLAGVVQNINTRRGNYIIGTENIILWGKSYITERLGDISYLISPGSFFQVNSSQAEVLFRQVEKYAALSGSETVYDLYCGTGTIALYLSRRVAKVIGIESFAPAVEDARKNARLNGVSNAEFFAGPAEEFFPQFVGQGHRPDIVIVDPPRKGCSEKLLTTLADAKPKRLIYVSCNPSTLARDLRFLQDKGYTIHSPVQPVDMFPQTSHVECVIEIQKV